MDASWLVQGNPRNAQEWVIYAVVVSAFFAVGWTVVDTLTGGGFRWSSALAGFVIGLVITVGTALFKRWRPTRGG